MVLTAAESFCRFAGAFRRRGRLTEAKEAPASGRKRADNPRRRAECARGGAKTGGATCRAKKGRPGRSRAFVPIRGLAYFFSSLMA